MLWRITVGRIAQLELCGSHNDFGNKLEYALKNTCRYCADVFCRIAAAAGNHADDSCLATLASNLVMPHVTVDKESYRFGIFTLTLCFQ